MLQKDKFDRARFPNGPAARSILVLPLRLRSTPSYSKVIERSLESLSTQGWYRKRFTGQLLSKYLHQTNKKTPKQPCIYICVCVYTNTDIYRYVEREIDVRIHVYIHTYIHIYIYIHVYTHTCIDR